MERLTRIRGVFDAPKDCSQEQLDKLWREHGRKFLDHFESEGWALNAPLDYYADLGASKDERIHYVMVGYFAHVNRRETGETELILPDHIAQRVLEQAKKYQIKARINE